MSFIVAACLLLTAAPAKQAPENDSPARRPPRRVWAYGDSHDGGAFCEELPGLWIEYGTQPYTFQFEQIATSYEFIELFDRSRDLTIRLYDEHTELQMGDRPFVHFHQGGWSESGKRPACVQAPPIDHKIRLVYFVPRDREPTDAYAGKIACLMSFVNELFAEEFRRRGWEFEGLPLQTDAAGKPLVHLVRGEEIADQYNGAPNYDAQQQFEQLLQEIPEELGHPKRHLFVIFPETYAPGPHRVEWPGSIGLGGRFSANGGVAVMSAWILRNEFCSSTRADQEQLLLDTTPIEGRTALGHGHPDSPRFEFIEDGFGAVAHELGHAFGLPHDRRRDNLIMGNGFRRLQRNFLPETARKDRVGFSDENARLLASSRFLNRTLNLADHVGPRADIRLERLGDGPTRVDLTAQDDRRLRGVVFFDRVADSVVGGKPLEGAAAELTVELSLRPDDASGKVKLLTILIDDGGNATHVPSEGASPAP